MSGSDFLNQLERDILATLEEAGEDHMAALLNTVRKCEGRASESRRFSEALTRLIGWNLIAMATEREKDSLRLVLMSQHESRQMADQLESLLSWSAREGLWIAQNNSQRPEVVLTDLGMKEARQILERDGWPTVTPWDT
jgi:hypothetical protein